MITCNLKIIWFFLFHGYFDETICQKSGCVNATHFSLARNKKCSIVLQYKTGFFTKELVILNPSRKLSWSKQELDWLFIVHFVISKPSIKLSCLIMSYYYFLLNIGDNFYLKVGGGNTFLLQVSGLQEERTQVRRVSEPLHTVHTLHDVGHFFCELKQSE